MHNLKSLIKPRVSLPLAVRALVLGFAGVAFGAPLNDGWTADGEPVTLPHCWNIVDGADGPTDPKAWNHDSVGGTGYARKRVVYRRELPPATPGKVRYVRVHAASIHAVASVDGREVARHAGAFTAFTFAVPADGKILEIAVDNFHDPDVPPVCGDFTVYGGLYRGVDLVEADPSRAFVAADGLFADELAVPSGLPRYEFRDDGFYVDGRRTFLKGVCYHQDREGKGWAVSPEDEEADIRLIKAMGANAIRTSHYPRSERFHDLCDRYGLYVWTEIPLVDATTDSAAFRSNTLRVAREMVLQHRRHKCIAMWGLFNELYLKKMPDGQAEPLVREVQALIRSLDPRPTVAASCRRERKDLHAIPDALGFNLYPGWYGGESSQLGARLDDYRAANGRSCVAVSEYGAGGSLGQTGGDGSRPKHDGKFHPLDYQLRHHVESWNSIKSNPRVWGAFVWQMFDCGSDSRHEGARDGINDKGLVGFDHKTLKPAYEFYRREWTGPKPIWADLRIEVTSSLDGSRQPGFLYVPPAAKKEKVPLFVVLHSWSFGYDFTRSPGEFGLSECVKRGWAFYYPHFRGPNLRPEACGSDLAVQDIVDGVEYAKAHANVDPDRIYLLGGSGGGHMALLMAGRHPEIWAGVVAACPISDVGRWHAETGAMTNGNARYARMLEKVCGGAPDAQPGEYRHRSPVTWLAAAKGVPLQIQTGIHDGHHGNSVPCGHAIRAFNCLAADGDRVSDETIAFMERTETVPPGERFTGRDPFFPAPAREIYLRRQSGNAQLTVYNAGHAGNYTAGIWWLARQRRGRPVDWTLPTAGAATSGASESITR